LHSDAVACLAAIDGAIIIGASKIIFSFDASNLVHAPKSYGFENQP
jgi:hypothetical protein